MSEYILMGIGFTIGVMIGAFGMLILGLLVIEMASLFGRLFGWMEEDR